jgi:hypothetical protein
MTAKSGKPKEARRNASGSGNGFMVIGYLRSHLYGPVPSRRTQSAAVDS